VRQVKFSSPQGKFTMDYYMICVAVHRMHAATVTDLVQLSPSHDHMIKLVPLLRAGCIHVTLEFVEPTKYVFTRQRWKAKHSSNRRWPFSFRCPLHAHQAYRIRGIFLTNTGVDVTGKCNAVARPDQSDRSGQLIVEYTFPLTGGSKGRRMSCVWLNCKIVFF